MNPKRFLGITPYILLKNLRLAFPGDLALGLQMGSALVEPSFRLEMPDVACRDFHVIDPIGYQMPDLISPS